MATKPQVSLTRAPHLAECVEAPTAAAVMCACVLGTAEADEAWR